MGIQPTFVPGSSEKDDAWIESYAFDPFFMQRVEKCRCSEWRYGALHHGTRVARRVYTSRKPFRGSDLIEKTKCKQ